MKIDNTDFEKQLASFKPKNPPDGLRDKLAEAIETRASGQGFTFILWPFFITAGLAAILCLSFVLLKSPEEKGDLLNQSNGISLGDYSLDPDSSNVKANLEEFHPIRAENELRSRIDDGVVFLQNGTPARRYRYQFMDTVVWENPKNGARMEMEIPREEVVVVPVHTF